MSIKLQILYVYISCYTIYLCNVHHLIKVHDIDVIIQIGRDGKVNETVVRFKNPELEEPLEIVINKCELQG